MLREENRNQELIQYRRAAAAVRCKRKGPARIEGVIPACGCQEHVFLAVVTQMREVHYCGGVVIFLKRNDWVMRICIAAEQRSRCTSSAPWQMLLDINTAPGTVTRFRPDAALAKCCCIGCSASCEVQTPQPRMHDVHCAGKKRAHVRMYQWGWHVEGTGNHFARAARIARAWHAEASTARM